MTRHPIARRLTHLSWRYRYGWLALLGLSYPLLVLSGYAFATHYAPMTIVHVEADIYSGRENPGWDLSKAEAADFRTRLGLLSPDIAGVHSIPDGLGYRGLRVILKSGNATQRLAIVGGVVIIEASTETDQLTLRDADCALEKWLLRTGKRHLGVELLHNLLGE